MAVAAAAVAAIATAIPAETPVAAVDRTDQKPGSGCKNLPEAFMELIRSYEAPVMDGLPDELRSGNPSVAIRMNRTKAAGLHAVSGDMVPWCRDGRYLPEREAFTFDPAFHQGLYYVQDPSSMIIGEVIHRITAGTADPLMYLDACAAPGGKTTAAIDALPDGSLVVANEFVPQRAAVLRDNLMKWGYPSVVVTQGDTSRFRKLAGMFDIVAADVPCSGEGMMRKDDEAVAQWSPALVDSCAALQREIVENLWGALAPGGYFIYSTCTFNRSEDEENLQWMIDEFGAEPVDIQFPKEWMIASGINTVIPCGRFFPHLLRGEGLFVGVMRKPDAPVSRRGQRVSKAPRPDKSTAAAEAWITPGSGTALTVDGDRIIALPARWLPDISALRKVLNCMACGVEVATVKGKDLIPAHALAMSTILRDGVFPVAEVDYTIAVAYLRREAVSVPGGDDIAKGYVLMTYKGKPLGWVKHLGNRANNLYPQSLRILSGHVPLEPPRVVEH